MSFMQGAQRSPESINISSQDAIYDIYIEKLHCIPGWMKSKYISILIQFPLDFCDMGNVSKFGSRQIHYKVLQKNSVIYVWCEDVINKL